MDNELINPPPPVSEAKKLTLEMDVVALVCYKKLISNFMRTTRFWNNHHQVRSESKHWKGR